MLLTKFIIGWISNQIYGAVGFEGAKPTCMFVASNSE